MALKLDRKVFGTVAKGDKLTPHLDQVIGQGDFPWTFDYKPKESDTAWHPSGDCTPTVRDLYCQAKGILAERTVSTSLRKTFMVGHFWHAYIQYLATEKLGFCGPEAIERKGCKIWDDAKTPTPFWWAKGSGDIAPIDIPGHGEYLIDIKTMNSHDFNLSKKSGKLPGRYVDKWECQVNIYMDFFDLEKTIILGVEKDSPHDFCEFEFRRNDKLIESIYSKWKLVGLCLDANIEPPQDDPLDDLPLLGPIR